MKTEGIVRGGRVAHYDENQNQDGLITPRERALRLHNCNFSTKALCFTDQQI